MGGIKDLELTSREPSMVLMVGRPQQSPNSCGITKFDQAKTFVSELQSCNAIRTAIMSWNFIHVICFNVCQRRRKHALYRPIK